MMTIFKRCSRCPTPWECVAAHKAGTPVRCSKHLEERRLARLGDSPFPPVPLDTPVPKPRDMELEEAADVVVRHWELYGARGFDASIKLLKRVLMRVQHKV